MKFTFEMSYHHNNPSPNVPFVVDAKDEREAWAKAFIRGMELQHGESFGLTEKDIAKAIAKPRTSILPMKDEDGENMGWMHVWTLQDDERDKTRWNRGFGMGGKEDNTTSKHENCWLELKVTGEPKTKEELFTAVEAMVWDLREASKESLAEVYHAMVKATAR